MQFICFRSGFERTGHRASSNLKRNLVGGRESSATMRRRGLRFRGLDPLFDGGIRPTAGGGLFVTRVVVARRFGYGVLTEIAYGVGVVPATKGRKIAERATIASPTS
jgi:hypothetical protein